MFWAEDVLVIHAIVETGLRVILKHQRPGFDCMNITFLYQEKEPNSCALGVPSLPGATHSVLVERRPEGPHGGEHEVQLIDLLRAVRSHALRRQEAVQELTQHHEVRDLGHGRDPLEADSHDLQASRDVLVEQDHEVGLLALDLAAINPAGDVTGEGGGGGSHVRFLGQLLGTQMANRINISY